MNSSTKEVLKINKLNAIYPKSSTNVLNGLELKMYQGDKLALVGSSGCGKSTVLRMISGLLRPSSGYIEIKKDNLNRDGGSPDIGFVFQDPTLMPWATVEDNVFLPLRLKGKNRNKVRQDID